MPSPVIGSAADGQRLSAQSPAHRHRSNRVRGLGARTLAQHVKENRVRSGILFPAALDGLSPIDRPGAYWPPMIRIACSTAARTIGSPSQNISCLIALRRPVLYSLGSSTNAQ